MYYAHAKKAAEGGDLQEARESALQAIQHVSMESARLHLLLATSPFLSRIKICSAMRGGSSNFCVSDKSSGSLTHSNNREIRGSTIQGPGTLRQKIQTGIRISKEQNLQKWNVRS